MHTMPLNGITTNGFQRNAPKRVTDFMVDKFIMFLHVAKKVVIGFDSISCGAKI